MEAIGAAANVIAVVNLSTKVAALCFQYSKEVAGARADIERLRIQVEHLGTAVQAAQRLVEGPQGQSLLTSQRLIDLFRTCGVDLDKLNAKLEPNSKRSTMRRLGFRALKWPFSSKEVDQILSSLKRHEDTIHLGLQIDQTSAIVEIQEGVKQLSLQATADACATSRMAHRMMPFPPNPDFVHRPTIEKWMHDQYKGPDRRTAVVGMGGFGKSQLAIEFAHQVHTDKPATSIFWVHANSRATFEESYRALADVLALPRRHEKDVDILALVRDHLQRDDVSPWLMVVDNADDAGVFFNNGHDSMAKHSLASYLPKSIQGRILVTSRSLDAAERLVGHSRAILRLSVMEEVQALELLTMRLESEVDEAAASELVGALGCIPIAINQAAAYINRRSPRLSVESYLQKFLKSEKQREGLLRSDKGDLGRQDGVSNSVVVTWQVTFEQIKQERPTAVNLLSLMSQFQAQKIPEAMLHGYQDDETTLTGNDAAVLHAQPEGDDDTESDAFETDIDILRGYSLVALPSAGFCEMHPLVQFCTRSWISEFGDPGRWSRLFMNLAATHFPAGKYETWGTCQNLLPHVEALLRSEARDQGDILDWAKLLTNASWYMLEIGEPSRAEMFAEQGAEVRKAALGPDHPDTLRSLSHLAWTYSELGRLKEAEKLGVEVMETRKARLGPDHLDTLKSINNLARTFCNQGRWEEAEKLEIEALETRKAKLGADHPDTLRSMNNLASTLRQQGRWEEAETLGVEVLEARKARLGADHIDTLRSMNNLASTFWNLGRLDEAEKLEVEVLETYKVKLGENHPDTLLSMNNLASTLWNQGRREEAEKLDVQVLTTCKAKLGPDHPLTLTSMNNLAITWYNRGRPNDAIVLMRDCVHLLRQKFGHTHPDTQSAVEMLERWQSLDVAAGDISSGWN